MNYLNTMMKLLEIPQSLVDYINSLSGLNMGNEISEDEVNKYVNTVCPDEQTFCKFIAYINALSMTSDAFKSVTAMHIRALNDVITYKNTFTHVIETNATDPMIEIWNDYCKEHSIVAPSI